MTTTDLIFGTPTPSFDKWRADSTQRNSDVPAGAVIHFVVKQQGILSYTSPDRTVAASPNATCFFQHRDLLTDEYHVLYDEVITQLQGKVPVHHQVLTYP
jgi:hypothetical protein